MDAIASHFRFRERGTTFGTEVKAGLATFMVMVYIVALNPLILSSAVPPEQVPQFLVAAAAATALVAGVMTILMGVFANQPIALAAGLGLNGVVTFALALGAGLGLPGAMGVVVLSGISITVLVVLGLREAVMNAVPDSLKSAIVVGIGAFILFIGLVDGGIIRRPEAGPVPVEFVFPNSWATWLTIIGLLITVVLWARRFPATLVVSILIISVIAFLTGLTSVPPEGLVRAPNFSTIGQFDITRVFTLGLLGAVLTVFSLMLADFFDTIGTATAINRQANLMDSEGRIPEVKRLLLVDSVAAVAGGAAGISSNTSYIESAAGVAEGGRTGFTSVVVGVLFLLTVLLAPLVALVPFQATAPALILIGFLMVSHLRDIKLDDFEEGFPPFFGLLLMPLTFSITIGIGAMFVSYVVIKVVKGKWSQVHPLMWVVAGAFAIYFGQVAIQSVLPR